MEQLWGTTGVPDSEKRDPASNSSRPELASFHSHCACQRDSAHTPSDGIPLTSTQIMTGKCEADEKSKRKFGRDMPDRLRAKSIRALGLRARMPLSPLPTDWDWKGSWGPAVPERASCANSLSPSKGTSILLESLTPPGSLDDPCAPRSQLGHPTSYPVEHNRRSWHPPWRAQ